MEEFYPLIPKSNSKLKPGQFWTIKLSNGQYGCGIVLDVPKKGTYSTRMFFAGLLNWTGTEKPTKFQLENSNLEIIDQGKAHIKAITCEGESIEGEVNLSKCRTEIKSEVDSREYGPCSFVVKGFSILHKASRAEHEELKTQSTWGFRLINLQAEKLLVT
jgi:hypothetical protein